MSSVRVLKSGVFCPMITPFKRVDEEIDLDAFKKQLQRVASAKMGVVLLGTNSEAPHLTPAERTLLLTTAREFLDSNGYSHRPIIAGCGGNSARESVALCHLAKDAGSDYALVITPGYFGATVGKNVAAIKEYYTYVADRSPIPVMIYNFPACSAGIDLDSDAIIALSAHPNIVGCKLSDGNLPKAHRIALHTTSPSYLKSHVPFFTLPGSPELLFAGMMLGCQGAMSAGANIWPRAITHLYELTVKALDNRGDDVAWNEAKRVADIVVKADWTNRKVGTPGLKMAMNLLVGEGMGGVPRLPLKEPGEGSNVSEILNEGMAEIMELEHRLEKAW